MNAVNSANGRLQDNSGSGSDSDSDSDDTQQYYQPISSQPEDDMDQLNQISNNDTDRYRFNCPNSDVDDDHRSDTLSNGSTGIVENGISSLDLIDKEEIEGEAAEEEEGRMKRESSEEAISRAFTEDERRRNAPLPPENATRVMEVMRGVSFSGLAPEWVGQIPEDRWIEQLRRMRQSPGQGRDQHE